MKTKRQNTHTTTPATLAPVQASNAERITADNVQTMGERIAVRALKTCYQKGGQPFIHALYCGLIRDITEIKKGIPQRIKADSKGNYTEIACAVGSFSDGYDVAQIACAYLCECAEIRQDNPNGNGKTLQDLTTDGQTDKDGNPVTILRACFRAVNRYIMGERQREYKRAYVDEIDEKGNALYYEIPDEWDIPTATDYKRVNELITALKLSQNEKRFLSYRLRGYSLDAIAQKMGIARGNVNTCRQRIKAKADKIGLTANA